MMFFTSLFSMLMTMSVVLTWRFFPKLHKKISLEVIAYRAVSDFMSGVGSVVGEQSTGQSLCWFEGIVANIFQISSVFWTVVITYMIYSIVILGKPAKLNKYHHLVCWGLPLVTTLLPLINVTYGNPGDDAPYGYCWITALSNSPPWAVEFWNWESFYFWIWGGLGVFVSLFVLIMKDIHNVAENTRETLMKVIRKLRVYPIIIVCCWVFTCVTVSVYLVDNINALSSLIYTFASTRTWTFLSMRCPAPATSPPFSPASKAS